MIQMIQREDELLVYMSANWWNSQEHNYVFDIKL